jgi:WhiB family redox-sensing transcriptional regulator
MNADKTPECYKHDPEMMFPDAGRGVLSVGERAAKQVCKVCPIRDQCLQGALDREEPHGVWGGMTEQERRVILSKRARDEQRKK